MVRRSILASLCIIAAAALVSAQGEAPVNLLKKWNLYGSSNATVMQPDGVIVCECAAEKDSSGVNQRVVLDQAEVRTIIFSGESKAQDATGDSGNNYCLYIDVTHTDGTRTYGVVAPFKTGTHDWETASAKYTPEKPVKHLDCYLLFRKKTGKVWFRNASLVQQ
ncbi:MAG: hypothetical protein AABZ39_16560 [Spirochaetota bacterium]